MLPENTKPHSKNRTPSRCREWERDRRNRFNNSINELGQVLRETQNAEDTENVSLPKIDIILKAIAFIKKLILEITQLKSELLAREIKLQGNKQNYKDASTQITKSLNTKLKDSKYNKLLMLKKCKHNVLKEKSSITNVTSVNDVSKTHSENMVIKNDGTNFTGGYNLPKLLPRSTLTEKSAADNTIVFVPAGPYVLPQRPLFFPAAPPAFVLLDLLLQQTNRSTVPIVPRMNNESTKTTMVNVVPITAFSHPLSVTKATKNKSSNKVLSRLKSDGNCKKSSKSLKKRKSAKEKQKDDKVNDKEEQVPNNCKVLDTCIDAVPSSPVTVPTSESKSSVTLNNSETKITADYIVSKCDKKSTTELKISNNYVTKKPNDPGNDSNNILNKKEQTVLVDVPSTTKDTHCNVSCEITKRKQSLPDIKDKSDKLSTILDTSLCENAVDTGNARLELAEELLAASPTAAFLMSFPLVSGNRAESPSDDTQNVGNATANKDSLQRRVVCEDATQSASYINKNSQEEPKLVKNAKSQINSNSQKENHHPKTIEHNTISKQAEPKNPVLTATSAENPFLSLPMPPMLSTSCSLADPVFDFDCSLNKTTHSNHTSQVNNNNNFLYKSDAFNAGKGAIYSTSNMSTGHDFNSFSSLYPCAMEKYASKNKTDFANVDDNIMKAHTSRLTYDIDLGWSHKSFDFVNSTTTSNSFNKDNTFTTTSAPFTSSYNPFNPDFHASFISNSNKKDIATKNTYVDSVTNLYSQPSTLWSDEIPFYSSNNINISKTFTNKQQCYQTVEHPQMPINPKINVKPFDSKPLIEQTSDNKNSNLGITQQISEKYSKKSPSKMHINWMTSETRSIQNNNCNMLNTEAKSSSRNLYGTLGHQTSKKQEHNDTSYFPIPIHNFSTPMPQEDFQVWPSARPLATAEISIDPPPINLPTLVGDLALGPHDKKRNIDVNNRVLAPHVDTSNCNNFFSVSHLMNRSSENMASRYHTSNAEIAHKINTKQNINQYNHEGNHKPPVSLLDAHFMQSGYVPNDSKLPNSFDPMTQYANVKTKCSTKSSSDKNPKTLKNNYSAEALLRGASYSQKVSDNNITPSKFTMPQQKYHDFSSTQDTPVAQVSHFPPILDYSENGYNSQQFPGTSIYSSTTNTISTSFYSNFIPGSTNLMSTNYSTANFCGDFIDYNQGSECNYPSHKYEEFKPRNATITGQEKLPSANYKTPRRETVTKHKLECAKKESNKKYQSKRPKINHEVENWTDGSNLFWQNRTQSKKHGGAVNDELTFPNYIANQMPAQYQPEFFNAHLMPSNVQGVAPNMDRSTTTFPATSRANFNLSTIFPEITMKVQ